MLVDVWGPKLFADVTVIQTFKGGGGQQFGGKKATHQHSGAEREKNVFLSMKLDTLNVDVGHLFCFGEQINERLKAPRTNERPNPNTNIVACMQYNRTIFKPAYPLQHQMPKLAGPTKKICPNHLTLPDYIFDSVFYIL